MNANQRAMRAVYASFLLNGAGMASLLSRVPQIRDALHLRPGPLGLLLLVVAIGSARLAAARRFRRVPIRLSVGRQW